MQETKQVVEEAGAKVLLIQADFQTEGPCLQVHVAMALEPMSLHHTVEVLAEACVLVGECSTCMLYYHNQLARV